MTLALGAALGVTRYQLDEVYRCNQSVKASVPPGFVESIGNI
jgi:hypothetical protein